MHNVPEIYQRFSKIKHASVFEKDRKKVMMILEMDSKANPDDLNIKIMLAHMYYRNGDINKFIQDSTGF